MVGISGIIISLDSSGLTSDNLSATVSGIDNIFSLSEVTIILSKQFESRRSQ